MRNLFLNTTTILCLNVINTEFKRYKGLFPYLVKKQIKRTSSH